MVVFDIFFKQQEKQVKNIIVIEFKKLYFIYFSLYFS